MAEPFRISDFPIPFAPPAEVGDVLYYDGIKSHASGQHFRLVVKVLTVSPSKREGVQIMECEVLHSEVLVPGSQILWSSAVFGRDAKTMRKPRANEVKPLISKGK